MTVLHPTGILSERTARGYRKAKYRRGPVGQRSKSRFKEVFMQRSVFEIIGPVMVGPSSSHTAGMARIGAEAARHFPGGYKKLDLCFSRRLEKTYKGHRSHIAAAGGAIGLSPDSPELKNSLLLAAEKKIDVSVSFFEEGEVPQNTLRVTFFYGDGT